MNEKNAMDETYAMDETDAIPADIPDDDPAAVELGKSMEGFFVAHGWRAYCVELISWLAATLGHEGVSSSRVEFSDGTTVVITVEGSPIGGDKCK